MEKYILLDSLLFKITTTPDRETAVLAILETCVNSIIALYHSSLFAGHKGVIKTYLPISDNFFYSQFNSLFMILYKRMPYMPTH